MKKTLELEVYVADTNRSPIMTFQAGSNKMICLENVIRDVLNGHLPTITHQWGSSYGWYLRAPKKLPENVRVVERMKAEQIRPHAKRIKITVEFEDEVEEFTFFWGGPFSQWAHSEFKVDGVTYFTAEQYMMACKARTFKDDDTLKKIMATRDPREQKKLGRQVKGFDADVWNAIARDCVYEGNYAKYTQNKGLWEVLNQTGDSTLVEASPTDRLWGIGLAEGHPDTKDRSKWLGVNWLGEVLTKVKQDIRVGVKTTSNFGWADSLHKYEAMPPI